MQKLDNVRGNGRGFGDEGNAPFAHDRFDADDARSFGLGIAIPEIAPRRCQTKLLHGGISSSSGGSARRLQVVVAAHGNGNSCARSRSPKRPARAACGLSVGHTEAPWESPDERRLAGEICCAQR